MKGTCHNLYPYCWRIQPPRFHGKIYFQSNFAKTVDKKVYSLLYVSEPKDISFNLIHVFKPAKSIHRE